MARAGLSTAEAVRRLGTAGPNTVPQRARTRLRSRVLAQLSDPLVLVLLFAGSLTIATADVTDTIVILLVVVTNTTVGVVQELRADRAVTALADLTVPQARVCRDGREQEVISDELVPGDVVLLAEGDLVPADGDLVDAVSLLVDTSAMTGESVPVMRRGRSPGHPGDELQAGTSVVSGRGVLEVTRTGASSMLGRIAVLTDVKAAATPLQRRMGRLGRLLATVVLVLSAVVLVSGLLRGQRLEPMLITAISLAVAAVPESLPAVVSLSLALGARRMAARHAIARRLPAVETLGSVTVLATDKTGTLTQGRMQVEELWTASGGFLVGVDGLRRRRASSPVALPRPDADGSPDVFELLRAAVLCNDARRVSGAEDGGAAMVGDPTEIALVESAATAGVQRADLERLFPRLHEMPFDSTTRQMTTVHSDDGDDGYLVICKGSPEALAARARDPATWSPALDEAAALAARGLRVLAFGSGRTSDPARGSTAALDLLGLAALTDPLRPGARDTILQCRAAGITPVLITGDHPATALSVAARVGIVEPDEVDDPRILATGDEIATGPGLDLTVPRIHARTRPEQKLDIVTAWQRSGAVVAMTGDGVNDGPALRRADIGVAMGRRGTEVARQAADLILADDDLATVGHAVEEGRRIFDNIRRFLLFGMAGGAAEILVMLLGPPVGLAMPLMAGQILWINLLTHGLTGVAFGAEPAEADVGLRPARPPGESVVGAGLWQRVLVLGAVTAATSLALGVWARERDLPWQSMLFLTLIALQLGIALGLRPKLFTRANPWLPMAVTSSLVLGLAAVHTPALRDVLALAPLTAGETLLALAVGLVGVAAAEALSRGRGRRTDAGESKHEAGSPAPAGHRQCSTAAPTNRPAARS